MAAFNQVILMGNVTRSPELKYTQSRTAICDLGLAVNDKRKDAAGNWVDEVLFCDVTFFGRVAEVCGEFLTKGSPVLVVGKLKLDTWQQDGQQRSKLKVVGDQMKMLGKPKEQEETPEPPKAAPKRQPAPAAAPPPESEIPFSLLWLLLSLAAMGGVA